MPRRINAAGLEIIKASEGFMARRYLCPAGKPTIGYGHVILPGETFTEPINQGQGLALLVKDVEAAAAAVEGLVTVPLTDNQFAAMASLTFNIGESNLAHGGKNGAPSTLLYLLNSGDYQGAAEEFPKWRMASGKVLPGLVTRRAKERALFLLTPVDVANQPADEVPAQSPTPAEEAEPVVATVPFQAQEKETKMPFNLSAALTFLTSAALPAAMKLGKYLLPMVLRALIPSMPGIAEKVSEKTKEKIREYVEGFTAYSETTGSEDPFGQVDDVLAALATVMAEKFGFLTESETPPSAILSGQG